MNILNRAEIINSLKLTLSQLLSLPKKRQYSTCVKYDGKVQTHNSIEIIDGHCNCPTFRSCNQAESVASKAKPSQY